MGAFSQRSFVSGEVSPALYARTDLARYAAGLRTLRNCTLMRTGGVENRAGTEYVCAVRDAATPVRLIKFVFNDDQTYVLEFGDQYLRVIRQGARITCSGVSAWTTATAYAVAALVTQSGTTYYCTTAHTSGAGTQPGVGASWMSDWYALDNDATGAAIYEVPTPYVAADLAALHYTQSADVLTLVHPSYAPRQLARTGHTSWTLTPIAFGPSIAAPASLAKAGGAVFGASTWHAVTALTDAGEESVAVTVQSALLHPTTGSPITLTWPAVTGASQYAIYRGRGANPVYGRIDLMSARAASATVDTTWGTPSTSVTTTTKDAWVAASGQARNATSIAAAADRAVDGKYALAGTLEVSATGGIPLVARARVRFYYSRNGETRVDGGVITDEAEVYDVGTSTTTIATTLTVPDLSGGYTSLTIDLVPEVYGHEAGTGTTFESTVTGTSLTWTPGTASYDDDGAQAPDYSLVPPPVVAIFDGVNAYPSTTAYYQQRQLFANTNTEPERVRASRTGSYHNFGISVPLQDDDAVSWQLAGRTVQAVRHLLDLGRLVVFTAGGTYANQPDEILSPSSINLRQVGHNGAVATLPPLAVVDTALYVQARGGVVRDLFAGATADGTTQFGSTDLSLIAAHLFAGKQVVSWDYAETPHSIVWAALDDGTVAALTYVRDAGIAGWHRHDTPGTVEQVCVVPEGAEDAVYLSVARVVSGATVRYIERMATRALADIRDACFLDCSLVYDGRNVGTTTMTLSGGVAWDETATLTCTASASTFVAGDVGNAVFFYDATGTVVRRCSITAYTSATVVTVRPDGSVPVALRGVASTAWARAVDTVTGCGHLEGLTVGVFGDGVVVASPYNTASTYPTLTVTAGAVALGAPYAVVRVGLSYLSDVETLDLDTPSGGSLRAQGNVLVNGVRLYVADTRGLFCGGAPPTDDSDNALESLDEFKVRTDEALGDPVSLHTGIISIKTAGRWNDHGRVFIRQVDPLPMTVLAILPQGLTPT